MSPVNLSRIQEWINQGRLNPNQPITLKELTASRAIHGIKDGIKLLADGASSLTTPINIVVSRASQAAIAAVEALGGTVTTRYYTPQAIKRIRTGKMHPYISLKWDPQALNKPTLLPPSTSKYDVTTPEHRVTGLGFQYRLPDPSSRKEIEYYRDPKNRGYLSHTLKEGEAPSLYFKIPLSEEEIKKLKKKSGTSPDAKRKEENKLW